MKQRWIRDVIYSVVLLVFSVILWVTANGFTQKLVNIEIAKPSVYAHLWIGLLMILSVIQLIRAIVTRPKDEVPQIFTPLAVITLVSLIIYVAVVTYTGFLLTTFVLLAVLLLSYAAAMGKIDKTDKKKMMIQIAIYLAVAFALSFGIKYLFTAILGAKLPKGKLFR